MGIRARCAKKSALHDSASRRANEERSAAAGPVWYLSEAGRHNLMTQSTGATARAILDKIEDEK